MKTYIVVFLSAMLFIMFAVVGDARCETAYTDWPDTGFTAYPDDTQSTVIVRDDDDQLVAQMILDLPGDVDLHNVVSSTVFSQRFGKRFGYHDINRNALRDQIYEETFDYYPTGEDTNFIAACHWNVWGSGCLDRRINEGSGNKWLQISFDGITNTSPMLLGLIQKPESPFEPDVDISENYIEFDISTTFSSSYDDVISADLYVLSNETGTYRLIEMDTDRMLPFPATGNTWQSIRISADSFSFDPEYDYDLAHVNYLNIKFLETIRNVSTAGVVCVDNIRIGENQLVSATALEATIEYAGISSQTVVPGQTITVYIDVTKSGDVIETVTSLQVFDSSFMFDSISESCMYDSSQEGEDAVSYIGLEETERYAFTVTVPVDAQPGTYLMHAIVRDAQSGSVLDTTGPDISFCDTTIRAYIPIFVIDDTSAPVALFDAQAAFLEPGPGVQIELDASASFHRSTEHTIVRYEWDVDNDGIFDYSQSTPYLTVSVPDASSPFARSITLRVTDDAFPEQSFSITQPVTLARQGTLRVTLDEYDNEGMAPAKCLLFDTFGNIFTQAVDAFGIATWDQLNEGDYELIVYEYRDTIFPYITLRGMCSVTVEDGIVNEANLAKNSPSINNISATYLDTGRRVLESHRPYPGRLIRFDITVNNDSGRDQICRIKMVFDSSGDDVWDIECPPLPEQVIATGEQTVFTHLMSFPKPDAGTVEEVFYAVQLETESYTGFAKTDERDWDKLCEIRLLPSRTLQNQFEYCGISWWTLLWNWQAGLSPDNVDVLDNNVLELRVQDYSGVGGQAESDSDQFHYGVYKAAMKACPIGTTTPEGVVFAFFHYWEEGSGENLAVEEIDVEIRSLDISNDGGTSYVSFSVHNRKPGDPQDTYYTVTYRCPVDDIDQYHTYSYKWKPDEIAFYIDDQLAYDEHGNPAVVSDLSVTTEGESFAGRMPVQPGKIICNHWSGNVGNIWSGTPPQGKGDFVGYIKKVTFEPVIFNDISRTTTGETKLHITAYNDYTVEVWATEGDDMFVNPTWTKLGEVITPSGYSSSQYIDNDGAVDSIRFYRLQYSKQD